MRNQYVLEWSKPQNSFHIQPLEQLLARNQQYFTANRTNPYITLMVGEKDACHRMADSWRERLVQRQKTEAA